MSACSLTTPRLHRAMTVNIATKRKKHKAHRHYGQQRGQCEATADGVVILCYLITWCHSSPWDLKLLWCIHNNKKSYQTHHAFSDEPLYSSLWTDWTVFSYTLNIRYPTFKSSLCLLINLFDAQDEHKNAINELLPAFTVIQLYITEYIMSMSMILVHDIALAKRYNDLSGKTKFLELGPVLNCLQQCLNSAQKQNCTAFLIPKNWDQK